jgi:hypothetical protein
MYAKRESVKKLRGEQRGREYSKEVEAGRSVASARPSSRADLTNQPPRSKRPT